MNNNNKVSELPTSTVDVLIVGNGPVGATIAALLGRYGVTTLVLDKLRDIVLMPRAIALDNEALRILQLAGLSEDAFEKIAIPEVRMHSPVLGQFGRADTQGCIDGHPKLVTFYQPDLEGAMRGQVSRLKSVTSLGGFELESLVEEADGVVATVRDENGHSHSVRAQYLIGADGASSRVRALIGQEFEGQTYAEDWLIVDARNRHQSAIDHIEFICDPRRLHYRQVLGRVLRRVCDIDDQAWLFVLAEPTLKRFSQRIADDLPDDLAVVCAVSASEFEPCSIEGESRFAQALPGEPGSSTPVTTMQKFSSPVDLDPISTYQISFSKNYRQQLLAVF
ncbi:2-polyprenyl-6-methoxyphenol hydroxylase-like FAD-dependent oxidoreductase [Pseudomonas laurylsulfatiphila]